MSRCCVGPIRVESRPRVFNVELLSGLPRTGNSLGRNGAKRHPLMRASESAIVHGQGICLRTKNVTFICAFRSKGTPGGGRERRIMGCQPNWLPQTKAKCGRRKQRLAAASRALKPLAPRPPPMLEIGCSHPSHICRFIECDEPYISTIPPCAPCVPAVGSVVLTDAIVQLSDKASFATSSWFPCRKSY